MLDAQYKYTFNFEELQLPDTGFWNGADTTVYKNYFGTSEFRFLNDYNRSYNSWSGFAFSSWKNTDLATYQNQWSVWNGKAHSDSVFGLGYVSFGYSSPFPTNPSVLKFTKPVKLDSLFITNSTYTALTIKNGNNYAHAFSTANKDYYEIHILPINKKDTLDTIIVRLADYTTNSPYIVKDWLKVDFSSLTDSVTQLSFDAVTTDVGSYGPNTPLYFCIDDISVESKNVLEISRTEADKVCVSVFPNPVDNYLRILGGADNYEIFDIKGRRVKSGRYSGFVAVNDLLPGIYILKVLRKDSVSYGKFIKK